MITRVLNTPITWANFFQPSQARRSRLCCGAATGAGVSLETVMPVPMAAVSGFFKTSLSWLCSAVVAPFRLVGRDFVGRRTRLLLVLADLEVAAVLDHGIVQRNVLVKHVGSAALLEDRLPRAFRL